MKDVVTAAAAMDKLATPNHEADVVLGCRGARRRHRRSGYRGANL
jgi:hypothetical protein